MLTDNLAGRLDRAARDIGLARRRRRASRADPGVLGDDHHVADAELSPADLLFDRDQSLTDLGGRGVHGHDRLARDDLEPDPGGRVVVEALREADVLVPDGVADAAPDALAMRGVADPAWEQPQVGRVGAGLSITCPVGPALPCSIALRRRTSTGSIPRAAASLSICAS